MEAINAADIDKHLSHFLGKLSGENESGYLRLIELLSQNVRNGSVCLDFNNINDKIFSDSDIKKKPDFDRLVRMMEKGKILGDGQNPTPLVLSGSRIYFYRYYLYERLLIEEIKKRLEINFPENIDFAQLYPLISRIFPDETAIIDNPESLKKSMEKDAQLTAAIRALSHHFLLISGAPGTGKTTSIVKALILFISQNKEAEIVLAAPTGKAAARLNEAINNIKKNLDIPAEIARRIPDEVTTLHRLLGSIHLSHRFRHSETNPLSCDLIVIDEGSMVDLPLFAKTLRAIPSRTRLILAGDHNQLASVESGSILGDICSSVTLIESAEKKTKSIKEKKTFLLKSRLKKSIIILKKNYRFGEKSKIAQLSNAIQSGAADKAFSLLKKTDGKELLLIDNEEKYEEALTKFVLRGFASFFEASTPAEKLRNFEESRILCAHRRGPRGSVAVNRFVIGLLIRSGYIKLISENTLPAPLPLLIRENNYQLNLFNGDTGLLTYDDKKHANVFFRELKPDDDEELRSFPLEILPEYEICFAMTVHKSQGSEFNRVALMLPEKDSRLITRELLYTAVSRTRKYFELYSEENIFSNGISRKIKRDGGLATGLTE